MEKRVQATADRLCTEPERSSMPLDRRQLLEHWVHELQNPSKTLTSWELSFLENVSDQLDRTGSLSTRQQEILEALYAEKTA
jgi:hypothetical protein